jgi:hypothetical protein
MLMRSMRLIPVTCLALLLVGCSSRPQRPGTGWGSASWIGGGSSYPDTTVTYGIWGDGMVFVVWSDLSSSSSGNSSAGDKEVVYSGTHSSPDGRHVDFQCTTSDGKTGTVMVAGKQLKLEDGSVFLVLTKVDPIQITQLKTDTLSAKWTEEGWEALVKKDPEFTKFFKAAKAQ